MARFHGVATEDQLGRCHIAEPVHCGLGWQNLPFAAGAGGQPWEIRFQLLNAYGPRFGFQTTLVHT